MKIKILSLFAILISFTLIGLPCSYGVAQDKERVFFENVQGQWVGSGQVVAGKYKGTNFTCTFSGVQEPEKLGMALDGACRVGIFSQDIKAHVVKIEKQYQGTFNNGAQKNGMDIISGQIGDNNMVFGLVKDNINGTMLAHLTDKNTMTITLSIKVSDDMVPVIGVQLKRNNKNILPSNTQTAFR